MPSSKSRRIAVSIGAGVLSLLLASCTGVPAPAPASSSAVPTSSAPTSPTATFTFGTAAQPLGLDPALASDTESYRITRQVLEGLVGVDQTTGLPTPLLATEWAESNEGRAYTFKLREGVTFQDGSPFDAASVCTNFNRWFNFPESLRKQAPGTSFKGVFKAHADQASLSIYKGCTALSAGNVRIDLTQPFTGFLQALTLPGLRHVVAEGMAEQKADSLGQTRDGQAGLELCAAPGRHGSLQLRMPGKTAASRWPATRNYWGDKGQIGTINFVTYDQPAVEAAGPPRRQDRRLRHRHGGELRSAGQARKTDHPARPLLRDVSRHEPGSPHPAEPQSPPGHRNGGGQGNTDPQVLHRQHNAGNPVRPAQTQRVQQQRPVPGLQSGQGQGAAGGSRVQGRGTQVLLPPERDKAVPPHTRKGLRRNQQATHRRRA